MSVLLCKNRRVCIVCFTILYKLTERWFPIKQIITLPKWHQQQNHSNIFHVSYEHWWYQPDAAGTATAAAASPWVNM